MTLILSGTDGLSDVDGSAATPAIRGTDANTGIFFPAADTIAFSEGGVEAMRIDSSGNVGIGTSSQAEKLNVNGNILTSAVYKTNRSNAGAVTSGSSLELQIDGTTYAAIRQPSAETLAFYRGAGGTTETARIDSSGNVGIGLTNPGAKLAVFSGSSPNIATLQIGYSGSNNYYDANLHSFRDGSQTERARIDSSGRLLVGQTSDNINAQLSVATSGNGFHAVTTAAGNVAGSFERNNVGILVNFRNNGSDISGAQIYNNTTSVSYATGSDYRLKHDIQPMTGALAKVAQLKPVTYKWNADDSESQGFIAHELQEVVPECVTGEKDAVETYLDEEGVEQTRPKYQGIDTSFLVATLTAAIQEQQALIATLTDRITALEAPTGTQA